MNVRASLTLDTLGRRCPAPIIELARHIGTIEFGAVVAVLSDDAAAALDVPAWCELRGQEYLGSSVEAQGTAYYVRRVQAGGAAPSDSGGAGGN
ncbi:MAG TPA: sulfurtransferase TusA family protein [Sporichthya sp.]|nr:sulfurtransferase TusA family protein [Sporichthya sp.]